MKENTSALHSRYVIDGIPQEFSPAEMLDECLSHTPAGCNGHSEYAPIADESIDPSPAPGTYAESGISSYTARIADMEEAARPFPMAFPEEFTRARIATALIDAIWKKGRFSLDNLEVNLEWSWNDGRMGNMAGFYASAGAAADYVDGLGIGIGRYGVCESPACSLKASVAVSENSVASDEDSDNAPDLPSISGERACAGTFVPDPASWVIYIPFDTCSYRLGGSMLAASQKMTGNAAPEIMDPDYFMDCYEVVREFVEDGVILSGATVGNGGLMTALAKMAAGGCGAEVNVSGLMKAIGDKDLVRILFSEVPGALIQIKDSDYDYLDAELLLQDVAWYPLGHVVPGKEGVTVSRRESGIQGILQALMGGTSEGED